MASGYSASIISRSLGVKAYADARRVLCLLTAHFVYSFISDLSGFAGRDQRSPRLPLFDYDRPVPSDLNSGPTQRPYQHFPGMYGRLVFERLSCRQAGLLRSAAERKSVRIFFANTSGCRAYALAVPQ